ncbi:phage minor structural protein GP20 domain-containing protein [Cordyceps javanica]|nr:phage minor structural protein GP20 domain-containing protein [Cordyceps javanica]
MNVTEEAGERKQSKVTKKNSERENLTKELKKRVERIDNLRKGKLSGNRKWIFYSKTLYSRLIGIGVYFSSFDIFPSRWLHFLCRGVR